jgi:type VI secretion system protein ImpA
VATNAAARTIMNNESALQSLLQPTGEANPCGESLEDTPLLASFDALRLFGQSTVLDPPPDWGAIKAASVEALSKSKDFRVLAYFAAAVVRTDGLTSFLDVLPVAAYWLENFWDSVYPLIDEDAVLRRNALNCFGDRVAVVDGLRRAALVAQAQLGTVSVRDLDISSGQTTPSEANYRKLDEVQINAIFAATAIEKLVALLAGVERAMAAVRRIETAMVAHAGIESAPELEPLNAYLVRAQRALREHMAAHPDAGGVATSVALENAADTSASARPATPVGSIGSREDAIRALEAVAAFFRKSEPSSPVPLFVERAKRLVAKDFLEVLADVAPDAVSQAKAASGIRDS